MLHQFPLKTEGEGEEDNESEKDVSLLKQPNCKPQVYVNLVSLGGDLWTHNNPGIVFPSPLFSLPQP